MRRIRSAWWVRLSWHKLIKDEIQRSSKKIVIFFSELFKYSNISWFSLEADIKGEFNSGIPLPWDELKFLQWVLESGRMRRSFVYGLFLVCYLLGSSIDPVDMPSELFNECCLTLFTIQESNLCRVTLDE